MFVKLKLKFDIEDKKAFSIYLGNYTSYSLKIILLEKDERFEAEKDDVVSYDRNTRIKISTSSFYPYGYFNQNIFYMPTKDKLGNEIVHSFNEDSQRKEFLRKLFLTLKKWSNYWGPFLGDSNTKFILDDNVWTFGCEFLANESQ